MFLGSLVVTLYLIPLEKGIGVSKVMDFHRMNQAVNTHTVMIPMMILLYLITLPLQNIVSHAVLKLILSLSPC